MHASVQTVAVVEAEGVGEVAGRTVKPPWSCRHIHTGLHTGLQTCALLSHQIQVLSTIKFACCVQQTKTAPRAPFAIELHAIALYICDTGSSCGVIRRHLRSCEGQHQARRRMTAHITVCQPSNE